MYRVLIADDEKLIRDGIRALLDWESLGFQVAGEAANGAELLAGIRDLHPNVVLLDVQMPGMTGLDGLRRAREDGFTGHVIILSGYAEFAYAQEAIRLQVDGYLTKPVEEEELVNLLSQIRKSLENRRDLANTLPAVTDRIVGQIQAFNRHGLEETMTELENIFSGEKSFLRAHRIFLSELMIQCRNRLIALYPDRALPLPTVAEITAETERNAYLHDVLENFRECLERVMDALGSSSRDSVTEEVIQYMHRNYSENLTLENIASLFGYNASYLGKLIRQQTGEGFTSLMDQIRVEKAKELLRETDLKVYEIAARAGYSDVDYFHVKFRKQEGCSPGEYRRNSRE